MMDWKFAEFPAGSVGEGWRSIVEPLVEMCSQRGVKIRQIKEKFGGLRFYTGPADEDVFVEIHAAEDKSLQTCECCGKPGQPRYNSWIKTLCDDCDMERKSSPLVL